MNKSLFLVILISFFVHLASANSAINISCSHPELCRLAKIVFAENQINNIEFTSLIKIVGDPHEYEPSSTEIKNLINASILISGPHELNPWAKKVNYQRSKLTQNQTINIPLDKKDFKLYPHANNETLSHFWLYPKLFCAIKARLEEQLFALKYLNVIPDKKTCLTEEQKIETELTRTLQSLKHPIILTHDALSPLLSSLAKNAINIVSIKGSGHHEEASTASVKKLYDALKAPKAIWIEEEKIKVPQNILEKKRIGDLAIKLDTANSEGMNYFQVLYNLNDKLKAIRP